MFPWECTLNVDAPQFVVNSFGSLAQAIAVALLLPVLIPLRGLSFGELPGYFADGKPCAIHAFSACSPLLICTSFCHF